MLTLFFDTVFFNIKFIEVLKFFSIFFKKNSLKHFFFIIHEMIRLLINYFNTIIEFLIEIKNYNIIILSKSDPDNELIKINTI